MIENLPRTHPEAPERPTMPEAAMRIREVTRQAAFDPASWTPERAARVAELFDGLASEWHTRRNETRTEPLKDALERGAVPDGVCVEVGSGTGFGTRHLRERFGSVVAIDLSMEMLRRAPADAGYRVCADGAALPLADGAARSIVLENALLFPSEIDRVLAPDGALVWVSSNGDRTPIYLPAEDVAAVLPGHWEGRTAEAGWGSWCVLSRASVTRNGAGA